MSQRSHISVLPTEVLQIIFGYLKATQKEYPYLSLPELDIRVCRLVCKSWAFAAESYFGREISLAVTDTFLSKLLNDISYFSQKVTTIYLQASLFMFTAPSENELSVFSKIINQCSNLKFIIFCNHDACDYLQSLSYSEIKLGMIQEIAIPQYVAKEHHNLAHLQVNLNYCATITRLSLSNLSLIGSILEGEPVSSIMGKFPNLIYFYGEYLESLYPHNIPRPSWFNTHTVVYLDQVFSNSPHLQEFNLLEGNQLTSIQIYENSENVLLQDSKLTTVEIDAKNMTIGALKFITENLKQVRNLVLFVEEIIPEAGLGKAEAKDVLNNLESYALNMKSVEIRYRYNDYVFEHNTKKEVQEH